MKFAYRLQNVLGSVYNSGRICFTPDGNCLLSPVGNKIVCYDLRGRSFAYNFECQYNFDQLAISPSGSLLLATSEKNHLYMCSLISGVVLHRKQFFKASRLTALEFSPDGRYYALAVDNTLLVYLTPGQRRSGRSTGANQQGGSVREISPFKIHRVFKHCYDDITSIAWSSNSQLVAVGSRDLSVKIFSVMTGSRFMLSLAGHSDIVEDVFFSRHTTDQLDLYSLSRNGQLIHWTTDIRADQLTLDLLNQQHAIKYRKQTRHFLFEHLKDDASGVQLTSAEYFAPSGLLVTGYSNGSFLLHELPNFNLIHSLELASTGRIDSLCINRDGQWIGLASSIQGSYNRELEAHTTTESKLVVWEWQSESFILKQTGGGNGIMNISEAVAYSPDGNTIATGSCSGQLKLWNNNSGFCYATLNDAHTGPVTGVEFVVAKAGKVLCSCSLDGSIRAFDLTKYRNFRTMSPEAKAAQFSCLSVDTLSGDLIAAGAQNVFEIFVFSLTTGKQLDELAGHEAPISAVKFAPTGNVLASASWDGTIRLWNLFETAKVQREVITVGFDCIALAFRPDGQQMCVSSSNSRLNFIDVRTAELDGVSIDTSGDLGKSQAIHELTASKNKHCTCITYTGDGQYVLAGGPSRYLCLYNVDERLLVKKYSLSYNLSLNGFQEFVSKRKISEFGFTVESIKMRHDDNGQFEKPVQLPGVAKGDLTDRAVSASIATLCIFFSPTMRSFVAATTDGVLLYSLDQTKHFDPYQLESHIRPKTVQAAVQKQDYLSGLMQSLKLNDEKLVQLALEAVPPPQIHFVVSALSLNYAERTLAKLSTIIEHSRHLEFYLKWAECLLRIHGLALKNMPSSSSVPATLRLLQRNLTRHLSDLDQVCSSNMYTLKFMADLHASHLRQKRVSDELDSADEQQQSDADADDDGDAQSGDSTDDEQSSRNLSRLLQDETSDDDGDEVEDEDEAISDD